MQFTAKEELLEVENSGSLTFWKDQQQNIITAQRGATYAVEHDDQSREKEKGNMR